MNNLKTLVTLVLAVASVAFAAGAIIVLVFIYALDWRPGKVTVGAVELVPPAATTPLTQAAIQPTATSATSLTPMPSTEAPPFVTQTLVQPTSTARQATQQSAVPISPQLAGSTTTACLSDGECQDDFSKLDTELWCTIPPQHTFSDGQLVIIAPTGTEQELKPCTDYNMPLKFIEVKMSIIQATSTSQYSAHAGIQSGLGDRYFSFKLNSAGGVYIYDPLDGDPEYFPLSGDLRQHTLKVEWTGSKILLFVDGNTIYEIASSVSGDWFLLSVKAPEESDIVASFDSIRWAYVSR